MALLLSVNNLAKSFSGQVLFSNLQFGIETFDRVGLLGPNGVGKSTLMRILSKVEVPDSGDVVTTRGLRVGTLVQSPQFRKGQTILSELLGNYELPGEELARAYEWIAKLELSQFPEETEIANLSGGWQKRVALALVLRGEPDLLLLDEPTNHLDVGSILWLEKFLVEHRITCFLITHDRIFLQRVATRILDLDPRFPGRILSVPGGYEKYLEVKEQMILQQNSREQKMANTLSREREWLARGPQARQTKQKARIESALSLGDEFSELKTRNNQGSVQIEFAATEKGAQKLVQTEGLGKKAYSENGGWLFRNLSLTLTPKTRLALLGPNGVGKTTLIRSLLGREKPDEGKIRIAEDLQAAYFEQNRETLIPGISLLKNLCPEGDYVDFQGQFVHVRSYLDRFKFRKEKVDLPVQQLSGGEQARLRIAQLMLKRCQVLVLDEPTNDLDVETLDLLQDSLQEFSGAVILVTHDRYFLDQVANTIWAFDTFVPGEGKMLQFADTLQWEDWYKQQQQPKKSKSSSSEMVATPVGKVKLSYKERLEFENSEKMIQELEAKLVQLQAQAGQPEIVSHASKTQDLFAEMAQVQKKLDQAFARWSELEAKQNS